MNWKQFLKPNSKKIIFVIPVILLVVIGLLIFNFQVIPSWNQYAQTQREKIKYCQVDADCEIMEYTGYAGVPICGGLTGCFNKNEKPLSDVTPIVITLPWGGCLIGDYPPVGCECKSNKCVGHLGYRGK